MLDKDGPDAQEQFMARVHDRLGSHVLSRDLEGLRLEDSPQYDPYEDETQYKQSFPQLAEELEPMPKVGDHYIGAEILLPRGDQMARGHVMARSRDAKGNVMGRSHTDPILDTRMYIAESMYAQCNTEGNEYFL